MTIIPIMEIIATTAGIQKRILAIVAMFSLFQVAIKGMDNKPLIQKVAKRLEIIALASVSVHTPPNTSLSQLSATAC